MNSSHNQIDNTWNNIAAHYIALREGDTDPFEDSVNFPSILSLMGEIRGKNILDAGSGTGRFTAKLAELGAHSLGIDGSEELVKSSIRCYPSVKFYCQDLLESLKFPDNSFDIVLCKYVLMSIDEISVPLDEFRRVLRKKGVLIVSLGHPVLWFYHWLAAHWGIKIRKGFSDLEGYFRIKEISIQIKGNRNIEVPFIYRPISFYLNMFVERGFKIARIDEAEPGGAFLNIRPDSKNRFVPKALNCKLQIDRCRSLEY